MFKSARMQLCKLQFARDNNVPAPLKEGVDFLMIASNQGYGFIFQLGDGISSRACCLLPC